MVADAFGANRLILTGYIRDAPTVLSTERRLYAGMLLPYGPRASPYAPEPVA